MGAFEHEKPLARGLNFTTVTRSHRRKPSRVIAHILAHEPREGATLRILRRFLTTCAHAVGVNGLPLTGCIIRLGQSERFYRSARYTTA